MASINLSGVLRDPLGEVSYGNKVRFTHTTTTGETVSGFRSIETVVIDGGYDIDLQYGNVTIETFDKLNRRWINHGTITINSDTPATSIPALIGITTPSTDEDLLVFQALVADAESARDLAEEYKDDAETAAIESNARIDSYEVESTDYLINTFDGSSLATGDVVKTLGFYEKGGSGAALWKKTGETGTASQYPSDTGDITLFDSNGSEFELMESTGGYDSLAAGVSLTSDDNSGVINALHSIERCVIYPKGIIRVTGAVSMPFGTTIKTAGYGTEFQFSGMTETASCFNVVRGGAGYERQKDLLVGEHTLVLVDSNAQYGWVTPYDSNVFIYEKPHIEILCSSMSEDRATTVTPYSFESIIRIGDCNSGRIELYGSGGYPTLIDDAGYREANGITLTGETGNVGVKMKVEAISLHTGLKLLDGVEGFQIEGEFAAVIRGIDSSEQTTIEPGGFIDNMHVNARDKAYCLLNRAELSIGAASAYKADSFYNDGSSEWVGFEIMDASSVRIGQVICSPGNDFDRTRNTAVKYHDGSYENAITHLDARNCGTLYSIASTETLTIGSSHSVNGLIGYSLTGTPEKVQLGRIMERTADLITDFLIMSDTVDRGEVQYNQFDLQVENYNYTLVSDSGAIELNPINDSMEQVFNFSSGTVPYTYSITLNDEDAAIVGTEFNFKISLPSSTNATVEILRKSSGDAINTFNVSSSVRLICRYKYTNNGTFERTSIIESNETSY